MRLGAKTTERRKGQVHSTLVQFLLRASSQPDLHADNEAWRKGKQTNARRTKLRSEQDSSGRKGWDVAKRFFNELHNQMVSGGPLSNCVGDLFTSLRIGVPNNNCGSPLKSP